MAQRPRFARRPQSTRPLGEYRAAGRMFRLQRRPLHVARSSRGSDFYLCRLSFSDGRFSRYPVLPVEECVGYRREQEPQPRDGNE
jgi:hypothetical protein